MDQFWPGAIVIHRQKLTVLERLLRAPAPQEGCALVLAEPACASPPAGSRSAWRIQRLWPCLNVWQPQAERRRRFGIDPREQLHAQVWARARGWQVLGSAHSHPGGPATPSATDRSLCFAPTLMVILGGSRVPGPEPWLNPGDLGCWWLAETGPPQALPWTMED